ncbi:VOC family protein [Oscillatoria sp. FACHB-1407]|uniref:VOC family protein n=1 Tax=Oscillatoria sp. FACHB-1407 TaxID=2692847 RepID=UPI001686B875|nr:VOC family protein [Oscillatoria sp. FACHB-1407]MBD2460567.1 VOC family protein [Oscillatoria sp. FACHB-1407]
MHKSQLAGFIIDCQTDALDQAAKFWSQALGYPIKHSTAPEEANYRSLMTHPNEPYIELQKVDHPGRVHLDIETDNIEAEVQRLEELGATRVKQMPSWWVMEAPTGHRFCVVQMKKDL